MRRLVFALGLTYLLGFLTGTLLAADACVTLQLRPIVLLQPNDVDVQVRVRRHADHRGLSVAWDSDHGYAGSRWFDLASDTDRVLFQWWNPNQPPAHYVYQATVYDARGETLDTARAEIRTADLERDAWLTWNYLPPSCYPRCAGAGSLFIGLPSDEHVEQVCVEEICIAPDNAVLVVLPWDRPNPKQIEARVRRANGMTTPVRAVRRPVFTG